ncbi:hypothetical protein CF8_0215 [Aeromonas phage CF8]|nr:hypothetical protein CF8_0215 [Aeromonas phage CF8]
MYYDYSVLVIAEPDFVHKVKDAQEYLNRLTVFLSKRAGETPLRMVTVAGKYAFPGLDQQPTDDRNKTAFVKSIDDYLTQLNEIVFVANFQADPFIDAVSTRATEAQKSTTMYGYEKK